MNPALAAAGGAVLVAGGVRLWGFLRGQTPAVGEGPAFGGMYQPGAGGGRDRDPQSLRELLEAVLLRPPVEYVDYVPGGSQFAQEELVSAPEPNADPYSGDPYGYSTPVTVQNGIVTQVVTDEEAARTREYWAEHGFEDVQKSPVHTVEDPRAPKVGDTWGGTTNLVESPVVEDPRAPKVGTTLDTWDGPKKTTATAPTRTSYNPFTRR